MAQPPALHAVTAKQGRHRNTNPPRASQRRRVHSGHHHQHHPPSQMALRKQHCELSHTQQLIDHLERGPVPLQLIDHVERVEVPPPGRFTVTTATAAHSTPVATATDPVSSIKLHFPNQSNRVVKSYSILHFPKQSNRIVKSYCFNLLLAYWFWFGSWFSFFWLRKDQKKL